MHLYNIMQVSRTLYYLNTSSGDIKEFAISWPKMPLLTSKCCGNHKNLITRSSIIAK